MTKTVEESSRVREEQEQAGQTQQEKVVPEDWPHRPIDYARIPQSFGSPLVVSFFSPDFGCWQAVQKAMAAQAIQGTMAARAVQETMVVQEVQGTTESLWQSPWHYPVIFYHLTLLPVFGPGA